MSDPDMGRFAREDIYAALARFGISTASRVPGTDSTEEIILLETADSARVDPTAVALAIMEVLPHVKVWVIEKTDGWSSETL